MQSRPTKYELTENRRQHAKITKKMKAVATERQCCKPSLNKQQPIQTHNKNKTATTTQIVVLPIAPPQKYPSDRECDINIARLGTNTRPF